MSDRNKLDLERALRVLGYEFLLYVDAVCGKRGRAVPLILRVAEIQSLKRSSFTEYVWQLKELLGPQATLRDSLDAMSRVFGYARWESLLDTAPGEDDVVVNYRTSVGHDFYRSFIDSTIQKRDRQLAKFEARRLRSRGKPSKM